MRNQCVCVCVTGAAAPAPPVSYKYQATPLLTNTECDAAFASAPAHALREIQARHRIAQHPNSGERARAGAWPRATGAHMRPRPSTARLTPSLNARHDRASRTARRQGATLNKDEGDAVMKAMSLKGWGARRSGRRDHDAGAAETWCVQGVSQQARSAPGVAREHQTRDRAARRLGSS